MYHLQLAQVFQVAQEKTFCWGGRGGRGEDNTKHSEPHGEDGTFLANPSCLPLPPGSHTWCCSVPGFWSCSFISVQSVVSDSL